MIFSVFLLISAGGLLVYNTKESQRVEKTNLQTVTELEKLYEQSVLENKNWVKNGFEPLRSYKDAIKEYIELIK